MACTGVTAYFGYLTFRTGDLLAWSDAQTLGWGRTLQWPWEALYQTAGRVLFASTPDRRFQFAMDLLFAAVIVVAVIVLARRTQWPEVTYLGLTWIALTTSSTFVSLARNSVTLFVPGAVVAAGGAGVGVAHASWTSWRVVPVRKTLARLAIGVIDPQAWVIDDTGQAKEGTASACVARQYSGTLGKIGNCQVAVSVHAVTDAASAPLDWPKPGYPNPPTSCTDLVLAAGRSARRMVSWRRGTRSGPDNRTATMRSEFTALRIRPDNRDIPRADDGTLPEQWLVAEWPPGKAEPTDSGSPICPSTPRSPPWPPPPMSS